MLTLFFIILAAAGGASNPSKDECPGIAPEILAHIVEFAEKESAPGSTYGSIVRKVGKWARAQQPPVHFTSEQRKCWLRHVKGIHEKNQKDFRKARWGMTIREVKATERGDPYQEPDGGLLYLAEVHGVPASIAYSFTNGILVSAGLEFPDALNNMDGVQQAIKKICLLIEKEAGKPIKKGMEGDTVYTVWQSKRTRAAMMFVVTTNVRGIPQSMDVDVLYVSVKHNTLPDLH